MPFSREKTLEIIFSNRQKSFAKGIDKIGIQQIRENSNIICNIISLKCPNGLYEFSPYLELLKPKNRTQLPRIISIPTIRDRIVLTLTNRFLSDFFKDKILKKKVSHEIKKIKEYFYQGNISDIFYVKIDIKNYYPSIDRDKLISLIRKDINHEGVISIIDKSIANVTVPSNYLKIEKENYIMKKGIPQGIPISNILGEIYLYDIDELSFDTSVFQVRWVDDILILGTNELSVNVRSEKIQTIIKNLSLEINSEKSICSATQLNRLKFLGYELSKNFISISQSNVERYLQNIAKKLTFFKHQYNNITERPSHLTDDDTLVASFIEILNEKITGSVSERARYGWLFYFSETSNIAQLYFVEKKVNQMISRLRFIDLKKIKRLSRTFHEIKFNFTSSTYFHNYDSYDTIQKKHHFLTIRGHISPAVQYSYQKIEELFDFYKKKNLSELEKDISYGYI